VTFPEFELMIPADIICEVELSDGNFRSDEDQLYNQFFQSDLIVKMASKESEGEIKSIESFILKVRTNYTPICKDL
jgi:hypothetical protein